MIGKSEAVEVLKEITDSGIIRQELEEKLDEIQLILKHEDEDGLSFWNANDKEMIDLFTAKREDLITEEWVRHQKAIYEKYRMKR